MIGSAVITMTNSATTLINGTARGRPSWLSSQIGRVCSWPAVNVVTISSSNDRPL